jgi:hypothetical protein
MQCGTSESRYIPSSLLTSALNASLCLGLQLYVYVMFKRSVQALQIETVNWSNSGREKLHRNVHGPNLQNVSGDVKNLQRREHELAHNVGDQKIRNKILRSELENAKRDA